MLTNHLDVVARLLATENLIIVRDNVRTASFDLVQRVLTMPIFKDMSPVIEEMMIGHEVGHAKHTTWKLWEEALKIEHLDHYFNIIEDCRIEKLMKREYPGLRKPMSEGYAKLNQLDFFGVQGKDLAEYNLIDRINLYYKVGSDCGVEFEDDEMEYVLDAAEVETERQALELAREILKHEVKKKNPKKNQEGKGKQNAQGAGQQDGEGESCEADAEDASTAFQDTEDGSKMGPSGRDGSKTGSRGQPVDDPIVPKTMKSFNDKMASKTDQSTKYVYYQLDPSYDKGWPVVIPFKQILNETSSIDAGINSSVRTRINEAKADSTKAIRYMHKEFEIHKAAEINKRIVIAKSGMLDMGKVYAYQLKDDIFRRNSIIPRGKNHGMIMLVDWSGSMDNVIKQTVKQFVDLAMFCRKASIPFRVFAFTTGYAGHAPAYRNLIRRNKTVNQGAGAIKGTQFLDQSPYGFNLLEFLSSDMTNKEFNTMVDRLLSEQVYKKAAYGLGGTPFNEALVYMLKYIPEFRSQYGVEKLSLITLTDGAGSMLLDRNRGSYYYAQGNERHFIRDEVTGKNYDVTGYGGHPQSMAILQVLKHRFKLSSIGFHIIDGTSDVGDAIRVNAGEKAASDKKKIKTYLDEYSAKQFFEIVSPNRDRCFVLSKSLFKIASVNAISALPQGASAEQAARALSIEMEQTKKTRVVLDKFIQTIA